MMKQLRSRKTMRRIMLVTLVVTIPAFVVFYGWGSGGKGQRGLDARVIATVKPPSSLKRVEITTQDGIRAKNQLINQLANQLQQRANPNQIEQAISNKTIVDTAVDLFALQRLSQEHNLTVTPRELSYLLSQAYPGASIEQIRQALQNQGIDFRSWLNDLQRSRQLNKARIYVEAAAHVPLPALWNEYVRINTQASLQYAEVPVQDRAEEMTVTDEDLQQEYDKQREDLREPDKAVYDYVAVRRFDIQQKIQVTDEQALEFYEANKEQFLIPGQATIRHVLITLPAEPTAQQKERAESLIQDVYAEAQSGVPLSELANEYSEDPQNTRVLEEGTTQTIKLSGLLPTPITREQEATWGSDFVDAVFSQPLDTISSPVLTNRGWDIFEVISRTDERYRPLDEVRDQVDARVKAREVSDRFEQAVKDLQEARQNISTLEGIASRLNLDVQTTSPTVVGAEVIPGLGSIRGYLVDITELQPGGDMTGVIETASTAAVVRMEELIPSHIPDLEDVRQQLTREIQLREAFDAALEQARSLTLQVQQGDQLTSAAALIDLVYGSTDQPITLGTAPFPYSQMQDLDAWVMATPAGGTFITEGFKVGDIPSKLYVARVLDKEKPSRDEFFQQIATLYPSRLYERQQTLLEGYYLEARKRLDPQYNPDFVVE